MTLNHLIDVQCSKQHKFDIYDYRVRLLCYDSVIIRLGLISGSLIMSK